MAKEYLSQKGIHYTDYDVSKDPKALEEMIKVSGVRSVPVISACGEVLVGFDKSRIDQMLSCVTQRTDV
jgi:glutaredoxin